MQILDIITNNNDIHIVTNKKSNQFGKSLITSEIKKPAIFENKKYIKILLNEKLI